MSPVSFQCLIRLITFIATSPIISAKYHVMPGGSLVNPGSTSTYWSTPTTYPSATPPITLAAQIAKCLVWRHALAMLTSPKVYQVHQASNLFACSTYP